MARKGTTVRTIRAKKKRREPIVALTAYDYTTALLEERAGVDLILVGDSFTMVVLGEDSTLTADLDVLLAHTRAVVRGAPDTLVVGDMPFGSYQCSPEQAVRTSVRFLAEAGAGAVKLEGGRTVSETIKAISGAGIPVQAHIGLTPQSVHQMGGYRVQRNEEQLMADALEIESAGAFSVVLEGIPSEISEKITKALAIPTIGIGAGPHCDGQILVLHDLLGLNDRHLPKFVKQYANLLDDAKTGIKQYVKEVQAGKFPAKKHCY